MRHFRRLLLCLESRRWRDGKEEGGRERIIPVPTDKVVSVRRQHNRHELCADNMGFDKGHKGGRMMTKCKDCKHWIKAKKEYGICSKDYEYVAPEFGCIFAERADGLVECCATCRQLFLECDFLNEALPDVCLNKMLCPEWQPREEKE